MARNGDPDDVNVKFSSQEIEDLTAKAYVLLSELSDIMGEMTDRLQARPDLLKGERRESTE